MAWLWWLSGPVVATVVAAIWSWLRARPGKQPTTAQAMQAHGEFLDALVETARSRERGLRSPDG